MEEIKNTTKLQL